MMYIVQCTSCTLYSANFIRQTYQLFYYMFRQYEDYLVVVFVTFYPVIQLFSVNKSMDIVYGRYDSWQFTLATAYASYKIALLRRNRGKLIVVLNVETAYPFPW